jgi:hypothetical protein
MKRLTLGAVLTVFCLTLFACKKDGDFLYYRIYDEPQSFSTTQKVKDFSGVLDLDILWIIDNSGSMGAYQTQVIQNTDDFITAFSGGSRLRWKMGLISTDGRDKTYEGFDPAKPLDYTDPNSVPRFRTAVRKLGTNGSQMEKVFEPIINHLTANKTFLRPGATLAIIAITDAPEQSSYRSGEFLKRLQALKPDLTKVLFYGAFAPMSWCYPSQDDMFAWPGSEYEKLTQSLQGKTYPICSSDFGKEMLSIGQDLFKRTTTPKVFLQARANPSTIRVFYKGTEIPGGPKSKKGYWTYDYDLNAIIFHDLSFAPGDQEEIEVLYDEDLGFTKPDA